MGWDTCMADMLKEWIALSQRVTNADHERIDPPREVWLAIVEGIDSDAADTHDDDDLLPSGHQEVVDVDRERTHRAPNALRRRRHRILAGLAFGVAAIVLGFSFLTGDEDQAASIAHATNAGLPEPYSGSATATVIGDGSAIRVEFTDPLPTVAPVELWLLNVESSEYRSLGLVDDDTKAFLVPDDIELGEFSTIDLSIEPNDGDPTHSGRSILRGRFLAS